MSSHGESIKYAADPWAHAADAKKKPPYATERDTAEGQRQRRVYQEKVSDLDAQDLVFVDATGVNSALARRYARAPKGERASASAPINKGKNVTVLGALSLPGMVEVMTIDGSADGQVVSTFIQDVLVPA